MTPDSRTRRHYTFTNPDNTPRTPPLNPVMLLTLALRDDGLADALAQGAEIDIDGNTFRVVARLVVP